MCSYPAITPWWAGLTNSLPVMLTLSLPVYTLHCNLSAYSIADLTCRQDVGLTSKSPRQVVVRGQPGPAPCQKRGYLIDCRHYNRVAGGFLRTRSSVG